MKVSNEIGEKAVLDKTLAVAEQLSNKFDIDLAFRVLKEIYIRPYLPSSRLSEITGIKIEDLKTLYAIIRRSDEAKDLFGLSAFPFLVGLLRNLSKDSARTLTILKGQSPSSLFDTLELFISEACNANCKFCYRNGRNYAYPATMSARDYVRIINDFADGGGRNLDVSGGLEPLLSPAVLEVLQTGVDRGLNVGLYTNGIALAGSQKIKQLLNINRVRISLNAYNRRSYSETMGVDEFHRVISNIKTLVGARESNGSKVKIGTSFVVYGENYKHIWEVVRLAQRLRVDYLGLRCVEVIEKGGSSEGQKKKISSILERVRYENSLGRFGKLNVSVADTFNEVASSRDYIKYFRKNLVAALPYYRITVTPQGKVYALNLIGQPSREDDRYLLGDLSVGVDLSEIVRQKKSVPFEMKLLLAHDFSLIMALSKLVSDLEFGISLEENPFNWT